MTVKLLASWGYWEKANYPNRFRRGQQDQRVTMVDGCTRQGGHWVALASGEVVETDNRALAHDVAA